MVGISRLLTGIEALENSLKEEIKRVESHKEYVDYHRRMLAQEEQLLRECKLRRDHLEISIEELKKLEGQEQDGVEP
ncbi:MAG: hypothetical protein E6R03_12925 [Hyphomicrobiaceae bacterium]|nr:MAG: hypothetical protein E6R03_12925 [Hyphomicrobiaceae bacterium]